MRHVLLALAFASIASVTLAAGDAKVELFNELVGPAMKTESLRLLPDGKVIEEKYDLYNSKSPHTEVILCSHSPDKVAHLVAQASTLVGALPHVIDEDAPVPVDGPTQTIAVAQANVRLRSIWYSPASSNASRQARQFVRAWQSIKALLLSCHKA